MIEETKIKEGLFFTLPCKWDEKGKAYVYELANINGKRFVTTSIVVNVLIEMDELKANYAECCLYDERGFQIVPISYDMIGNMAECDRHR